ncbi:MAG: hypothetical protein GTO53_13955, partial [Planctomycetales bacterium]|nr:hypothetical protein [Planctomycetales bacterium]NIM10191.1 hypothetical protein [Planctomycetales bacterium]NIN78738.1 hypothetical protein [Planctomycetales bacterium]NIO35912.1 hypothetical protein [Planctomycetales bacterium]NIP71240.1 hypothetical protein [Planctomycetales bacterium]
MGALLVLLVVIAQRAQAKAQAQEEVQTAERVRAHRTQVGQLRQLQQQLSNLQRLRDETAGRLAERRALLAHSQDHTRRLRAELAAVQ